MKTTFKLTAIAAVAVTLTACGGGGGGGSSIADTAPVAPSTPAQVVVQSPTAASFPDITSTYQAVVQDARANPTGAVTGSSAVASTNTDERGSTYAAIFSNKLTLQGFSRGLSNLNGLIINAADNEVTVAQAQGWTGKDQNVLIMDSFSPKSNSDVPHGGIVATLAARTAPGANYTSFDISSGGYSSWEVSPLASNSFQISDTTILNNLKGINYQAVNMSFGVSNVATAQQYKDGLKYTNELIGTLHENTPIYNRVTTSDAVIVKAAGNSSLVLGSNAANEQDALSKALMDDSATRGRTLLVGALSSPTSIAGYSNRAGSYAANFVVANGHDPFANYAGVGTSYAAPRVTGYVAIVRQKFATVTGSQAAGIILDSAKWNSAWGVKNAANQAIYGQGEASLSQALAPTARLR